MDHSQHAKGHCRSLAVMALLSFAATYVLMYAMFDRVGNALPNWNQAYMAGLMTAPISSRGGGCEGSPRSATARRGDPSVRSPTPQRMAL
jgi:hypothetical protein